MRKQCYLLKLNKVRCQSVLCKYFDEKVKLIKKLVYHYLTSGESLANISDILVQNYPTFSLPFYSRPKDLLNTQIF